MSEADEQECLARARGGDREAFGRLVAWHRPAAVAAVRRLARDYHTAQDIAQEALLRALHGVRQLGGRSGFGPWLCQIARNVAIDRLRGARRDREVELDPDADVPSPGAVSEALPASGAVAEEAWRTLAELCERDQRLLMLRFGRGLSYAQISRELGVSPGLVKTAIWRSRARVLAVQRAAKDGCSR